MKHTNFNKINQIHLINAIFIANLALETVYNNLGLLKFKIQSTYADYIARIKSK